MISFFFIAYLKPNNCLHLAVVLYVTLSIAESELTIAKKENHIRKYRSWFFFPRLFCLFSMKTAPKRGLGSRSHIGIGKGGGNNNGMIISLETRRRLLLLSIIVG